MNFDSYQKIVAESSRIVIIGYPNSGKSLLASEMEASGFFAAHTIYRTDEFKHLSYRRQLIRMLEVLWPLEKWIVEGIQGYRLLRKIEEMDLREIRPNLILITIAPTPPEPKHQRMVKGLHTIWTDYIRARKKKVKMVKVKNVKSLASGQRDRVIYQQLT